MKGNLLYAKNLTLDIGDQRLLDDISLSVTPGSSLGIVGESGSGKSLTIRAFLGLLPQGARTSGEVSLSGTQPLNGSPAEILDLRRTKASMIFQDPRSSMNPVRRIGDFLVEASRYQEREGLYSARLRAIELMQEMELPDPERHFRQFPHELSGGMLQRILIAGAIMTEPKFLLCDEPTSALDVLSQQTVMKILRREQKLRRFGMIFVTHDLNLASSICDEIAVLRRGRIVEAGRTESVFTAPRDEYTRDLLTAQPSLTDLLSEIAGTTPSPSSSDPVIRVRNLRKSYRTRKGTIVAVDDVTFSVATGESLAIVGESGSGKSTCARMLIGMERPESGDIRTLTAKGNTANSRLRPVQIVFQDPYQSLDPRRTVQNSLNLVLRRGGIPAAERRKRIAELIDLVGLSQNAVLLKPKMLSGGQRQRVAIAKALASDPEILILDEATSALDVTTQAQVIGKLNEIRRKQNLSMIVITHDLTLVGQLADRVIVLRRGRVVEEGTVRNVLGNPREDYTRNLVAAIPRAGFAEL